MVKYISIESAPMTSCVTHRGLQVRLHHWKTALAYVGCYCLASLSLRWSNCLFHAGIDCSRFSSSSFCLCSSACCLAFSAALRANIIRFHSGMTAPLPSLSGICKQRTGRVQHFLFTFSCGIESSCGCSVGHESVAAQISSIRPGPD